MAKQTVDKQGRPVKFIRVKGRIVPVKADKYAAPTGKASGKKALRSNMRLSHNEASQNYKKRKGARRDKATGYYFDKDQRAGVKKVEKYNEGLMKARWAASKTFQDVGTTLGLGLGVFSAVAGGRGTKGIIARGLGGAAAGFVAGGLAASGRQKRAADKYKKDYAQKAKKLKKGSSV